MTTVEHVVLFNVKDDADPAAVNAWIDGINSLTSLEEVIHLTAGPILRTRSLPSDLRFTHLLHGRYRSKSDLEAYSAHPAHQRVVNELGQPVTDDVMAIDWTVGDDDESGPKSVHPGRALRFTCFKFRNIAGGGGDNEKEKEKKVQEVVQRLKRIKKERSGTFEEMGFGEEIMSVDRAKGYTVAAFAVFSDLNELDACEEYEDAMRSILDRANIALDGVIDVDYLVPRS